jgi:hypothetical protein
VISAAAVPALASGVLALIFAWAGLAKAIRVARWREDLVRYRLPRALRVSAFLVLPWVELSVVIALVSGASAAGAAVGLGLMLAFSLAILRARLMQLGNRLGCGCFGNAAVLDYRVMLLRNAAMAALLAFVLTSRAGRDGEQGSSLLTAGTLPVLLGLVLVAAGVWISWQVSVYLRRRRTA